MLRRPPTFPARHPSARVPGRHPRVDLGGGARGSARRLVSAIVDDAPSNVTSEFPDLVALVQADDGQLVVERVPLGDGPELAEAAAGIAADGTLVSAAFDEVVQLDEPAAASASDAHASTSNDTYRWQQWALDRVPFETSWSTSTGSGVVVAVIDTAVDLSHGDLAGQFVGPYFFTSNGSGPGMQSVPPGNFHGTHVSGIIAAVAGNGTGVAGGAPGVKIMPIEVLNGSGSGRYSDITAAIVWATDHGADVINLSLGGAAQFGPLDVAVAYAGQHGVLVMAAAGNDGCSVGNAGCAANYPAASPGAIAIGSVASDLSCSAFTTRADYVALGAPGSSVVSTAPTNLYGGSGYVTASGTSMATPYASAAAAILVAAHPERTALDIRDALFTSAVDVAEAGNDTCTGHGLIDPVAALDELDGSSSTPGPTSPTSLEAPRLAGVLAGRGMVRLSFVAPPGATSIFVRRDGVLLATIAANRRSFTDRTVSTRSPYTYEVSAWSATAGEGPRSVTRTVTTRG